MCDTSDGLLNCSNPSMCHSIPSCLWCRMPSCSQTVLRHWLELSGWAVASEQPLPCCAAWVLSNQRRGCQLPPWLRVKAPQTVQPLRIPSGRWCVSCICLWAQSKSRIPSYGQSHPRVGEMTEVLRCSRPLGTTYNTDRTCCVSFLTPANCCYRYTFHCKSLIAEAFTHGSCLGRRCYQRLEFLGDAVLDAGFIHYLYRKFE
jgi:hypothetical protein